LFETSVGEYELALDDGGNGDDYDEVLSLPGPVDFLRRATTGGGSVISELGDSCSSLCGGDSRWESTSTSIRATTTTAPPPLSQHTIRWPGAGAGACAAAAATTEMLPPIADGSSSTGNRKLVPSFMTSMNGSGTAATTPSPTRQRSPKPAMPRIHHHQRGNNIKNALAMATSIPCLFGESASLSSTPGVDYHAVMTSIPPRRCMMKLEMPRRQTTTNHTAENPRGELGEAYSSNHDDSLCDDESIDDFVADFFASATAATAPTAAAAAAGVGVGVATTLSSYGGANHYNKTAGLEDSTASFCFSATTTTTVVTNSRYSQGAGGGEWQKRPRTAAPLSVGRKTNSRGEVTMSDDDDDDDDEARPSVLRNPSSLAPPRFPSRVQSTTGNNNNNNTNGVSDEEVNHVDDDYSIQIQQYQTSSRSSSNSNDEGRPSLSLDAPPRFPCRVQSTNCNTAATVVGVAKEQVHPDDFHADTEEDGRPSVLRNPSSSLAPPRFPCRVQSTTYNTAATVVDGAANHDDNDDDEYYNIQIQDPTSSSTSSNNEGRPPVMQNSSSSLAPPRFPCRMQSSGEKILKKIRIAS
jgi:hypothetical protein